MDDEFDRMMRFLGAAFVGLLVVLVLAAVAAIGYRLLAE